MSYSLMAQTGVRTQVAAVEPVSIEEAQKVETPVAVVTGASRGIGKAIALAFGKAGCKVRRFISHFDSLTIIKMKHLACGISALYKNVNDV